MLQEVRSSKESILDQGESKMKTSAILISAAIALVPAISLAQAQTQAPAKQASSNPVQDAFNVFNSDFSNFSDLAEVEAINGPKKLELARKMKADAQAWFNALQVQLVASAKENASLHDQLSSNQKTISSLTQQISALTTRDKASQVARVSSEATIKALTQQLNEARRPQTRPTIVNKP
jgi:hypothetical protein